MQLLPTAPPVLVFLYNLRHFYEFVCTGVSAANETIALYGWKDKPTSVYTVDSEKYHKIQVG